MWALAPSPHPSSSDWVLVMEYTGHWEPQGGPWVGLGEWEDGASCLVQGGASWAARGKLESLRHGRTPRVVQSSGYRKCQMQSHM